MSWVVVGMLAVANPWYTAPMGHENQSSQAILYDLAEAGVDPDLVPTYRLEEGDYIRIINQLANLLIGAAVMLRRSDRHELSRALADVGTTILANYDPDVAECLQQTVIPGPHPLEADDPEQKPFGPLPSADRSLQERNASPP